MATNETKCSLTGTCKTLSDCLEPMFGRRGKGFRMLFDMTGDLTPVFVGIAYYTTAKDGTLVRFCPFCGEKPRREPESDD